MDALVAAHCRRAQNLKQKRGWFATIKCKSEETFGNSRFNFFKICSYSNFGRRIADCIGGISKYWCMEVSEEKKYDYELKELQYMEFGIPI